MSHPKAVDRGVELLKFVLELLKSKPEGMRPQEIYKEIISKITFDAFDSEIMSGSGLPRWRVLLHFQSVAATKAGLLIKSDGQWRITDEGRQNAALAIAELKKLLRSRYREWRWGGNRAKGSTDNAEVFVQPNEAAPVQDASVLFEDAKQKARAEIDAYLDALDAYDFQDLVAALVEAMGYAIRFVAPPGADGGTDVLAYTDPLGARTPHIRVQVKHRNQAASRDDIASLRGIIRADREIGLFVSSGGFTRDARREAGMGAVHIELVDLERFLELWVQYYGKISEPAKAKLRLQPVYFLAPEMA